MATTSEPLLLPEPEKPKNDVLRLPNPIIHSGLNSGPDRIPYRWIILASTSLAVFCAGAISGYYNFLEVLLVDVFV